jgi:probable F420-dependent oxidoreductase
MHYGLALPTVGPGASPEAILRAAVGAEHLGLDSVWVSERHLRPLAPVRLGERRLTLPVAAGLNYDPIEALTFVAARTKRIRLGTSVLLSLLHRPVHLARRLATLDVLSGGRVIAGLGQPMIDAELVAAGVPPGWRGAGFGEFVEALRAVWGPDPVHFDGHLYEIPPSEVGPKPVQPGGPVVLAAATAPASIRRAAALGLGLNPQLAPTGAPETTWDGLVRIVNAFRAAAEASGRDPASLPVVVRVTGPMTDRPPTDRMPLTGAPEQVAEDLPRLEALGVEHVFWGNFEAGDPERQLGFMERLLAQARRG